MERPITRLLAVVSTVTTLSLSGCGETVTFKVENSVFYDKLVTYRWDGEEEKLLGSVGKLQTQEFALTVDSGETAWISIYGIRNDFLLGSERVPVYSGSVSDGDKFKY